MGAQPLIDSFDLAGKNFKVVYEDTLDDEHELGIAHCDLGIIKIALKHKNQAIKKNFVKQTILHEIFHCIFHEIGRDDLGDDEQLVQQISLMMHQVLGKWKG